MGSFSEDCARWAEAADKRTRRVIRRWVKNLHQELIDWTPVDTGALQSNMFVTEGRPSTSWDPGLATTDPIAAHQAQIAQVDTFSCEEPIYITSNAPYAWEIEFTDKSKKGKGMFRKTAKLSGRLLQMSLEEEK